MRRRNRGARSHAGRVAGVCLHFNGGLLPLSVRLCVRNELRLFALGTVLTTFAGKVGFA